MIRCSCNTQITTKDLIGDDRYTEFKELWHFCLEGEGKDWLIQLTWKFDVRRSILENVEW